MLGESNVMATIGVKDIAVARRFYEDTLGLTVDSEMPEAALVVYKSGSSQLQVYQSGFAGTNKATAATWETDDVEAVVAALRDEGVTFEHYADMPEVTLEGDVHSWGDDGSEKAAWFRDPDGNILCVHSGK